MQYALAYQLNGTQAGGLDPDAKAYILAVEAADGQTLESGVKKAYNTFVKGCKSDGIWDAIKASCIMAGARTLSGALVPLKGTAPTNFNFVSGDYNRKTGLVGDGSTKYLNSNRNNNVDPDNNHHMAVWATTATAAGSLAGGGGSSVAASLLMRQPAASWPFRSRISVFNAPAQGSRSTVSVAGFIGMSRSSGTFFSSRLSSANENITSDSTTSTSDSSFIFARSSGGSPNTHCADRLSYYSIGESLDLAALDSRVDRLVAELAFNINTGLDGSIYDIDTLKYINAGYAAGGTLS